MVEILPPTNTFKMTRLIGGKLRALYDEEAQPCCSRIANLLETLASGKAEYCEPWTTTKQPEQRQRTKEAS
jgi:hypothetical protein